MNEGNTTEEQITDDQHFNRHVNQLLDMLVNKQEVPWHMPWKVGTNAPANLASGRKYTGFSNIMLLSFSGFGSRYWITERKMKEFGGRFKEGEEDRFQYVFYWHRHKWTHTDAPTGETRTGVSFYPRTHKVWNVEQTEGIIHHRLVLKDETHEHEEIPEFETMVERYCSGKGPKLHRTGERAFYLPATDEIFIPNKSLFKSYAEYSCVAFHEMGHSTGHKDRLNRRGVAEVNTRDEDKYAQEELVAELCASYLMSLFGFTEEELKSATDNSVEYIRSWSKRVKENPKMFVIAGRQAEKAAQFILTGSNPF